MACDMMEPTLTLDVKSDAVLGEVCHRKPQGSDVPQRDGGFRRKQPFFCVLNRLEEVTSCAPLALVQVV